VERAALCLPIEAPRTPKPFEEVHHQLHTTPEAGAFPTTTHGTPNRDPSRSGNRQGKAPGWQQAISLHKRYCNSSGQEGRPFGCDLECLLRKHFPKTWESWNSKVFVVLRGGREKLVSGFFVHHFQHNRPVCKVLGEVVDGILDPKSKSVHRVDFDAIASPSMSSAPAMPCEQRVKRRQRQKAARRHTTRVEPCPVPGPVANQTHWETGPTYMQCIDDYFRCPTNDGSPKAKQGLPAPGLSS
jgi:hypothetical protein